MENEEHHFLPQFYLRNWCRASDRKLTEYGRVPPKMEIRSRPRGPASTGYVTNLYKLPGVTPETAQNVERVFYQELDTSASKVHAKMLEGAALTEEEIFFFARFLLSLGIRNPTEMDKFKAKIARDFSKPDAKTQAIWERIRKDGQPATAEEALPNWNPQFAELSAIITTTKLIQNRNVLASIMNMDWMTYDASQANRRFLTCDRPLILTPFGRQDGQVAIPLSPD